MAKTIKEKLTARGENGSIVLPETPPELGRSAFLIEMLQPVA